MAELSAKNSPFHALIDFFGGGGGGATVHILASCMTNLREFLIVFYSSALIRFNKDAFEGALEPNL